MPRRGMNIYKRKDGRWEGRIKKEGAGEGRSYQSIYGKTYTEVKIQMEAVKTESPSNGEKEQDGTVGEAASLWLKERSPYWKKTTYAAYFHITCKYILPKLENASLNCLDEERIEGFLLEIRQEKELSSRYQRNICALILRIMKYMKRRHHCKAEIYFSFFLHHHLYPFVGSRDSFAFGRKTIYRCRVLPPSTNYQLYDPTHIYYVCEH